jgi:UDP-glucose 4-epimerase
MCKALAERIVTSKRSNTARYTAVRYGNVLESRGSIIPLFKYQAQKHGKITVTNYDMTRFIMTLDDSVQLIDYAIKHLESGQICIPKLRSMKIGDLARIFSEHYNVPTHFIGERPGEKKHEDLINVPESARTIFDGNYFIVDSIWSGTSRTPFVNAYSSFNLESMLSQESLRSYLESLGVLSKSLDEFSGLKIEEINTANAK